MAIQTSKLSIEFGEGGYLATSGSWTQTGPRSATIKVRGVKAGIGTFTVKYDGKGDKTGTITVAEIAKPGELTLSKSAVELNDVVVVTQNFNIKPSLDDVTFEYPSTFTVAKAKAFDGNNVTISLYANTAGENTIKSKYKGANEKQATLNVVEPTMASAVASPDSINEEEESTITVTFDEVQ